jgi:hypothetical protein
LGGWDVFLVARITMPAAMINISTVTAIAASGILEKSKSCSGESFRVDAFSNMVLTKVKMPIMKTKPPMTIRAYAIIQSISYYCIKNSLDVFEQIDVGITKHDVEN